MSLTSDWLSFVTPSGARSSALPADLCAVIVDTVQAPATFILTNLLAKALRQSPQRQAILVGLANTFEHNDAILKKNGIHLTVERKKGTFNFIDGSSLVGSATLEALYRQIEAQLSSPASHGSLLILDDLSSLLWAGHDSPKVAHFFAGVRALVSQTSSSLVVLLHGDELSAHGNSDDDHLFRRVLQQSDLWLQTKSLSSQTRGELTIYRGPALVDDIGVVERFKDSALLYKMDEAGPSFSVKGLGKFM